MSDETEARWSVIDRELEQLRKDATGDMTRLIELLARGDALRRRDVVVQGTIIIMRHQQVMLALLRNLQWEVRLLHRTREAI